MKNNIPIVFSTDHNYIMPTGVAITSLLDCSKDVFCDIKILHSVGITDEDKQILTSIVNKYEARIEFICVNNELTDKAFEIRGITTACYYRLQIPWLLPQYDKVIYLDGDIVVKKSISNLYDIDIKDNYLAGGLAVGKSFINYAQKLGLSHTQYINSGVLIINSKKQRELQLNKLYNKHLTKKYTFQDQDILNIVCKNHIEYLSPGFNITHKQIDINDDNYIIHYAGEKPWEKITDNWYEWLKVFERSIFFDERLINNILFNEVHKRYTVRNLLGLLKVTIKQSFYQKSKN